MAETKQVNAGTKLESIGTVKTVVGEVKAVDAAGNERILQAGDKVFANETIVTANGGMVMIEFADGTHLDLASASKIVLDTDVFNPANAAAAPEGKELTAEQIQEMIARGEDPTAVTEASAAGAGAGDEGGSSFIVVDFNNTQGNVTSGFNTLGIPGPESTTFTELPPVEDEDAPAAVPVVSVAVEVEVEVDGEGGETPPEEVLATTPGVVVDGVSIVEGTEDQGRVVNFVIKLDQAYTQDVTVSYQINNGAAQAGSDFTGVLAGTVTIPAGQTSFIVPVTIVQDADIESNENFSIVLTGATNATINPGASSATVTIIDDDVNADNDADSVSESQLENSQGVFHGSIQGEGPDTANVLTNDDLSNAFAADGTTPVFGPLQVFANTVDVYSGETLVGQISFAADGTYTLTLNETGMGIVNALAPQQSLNLSADYTMGNTVGSTDTATLTITITGSNDVPTITVDTGEPRGGNDVVNEAGLAVGSDAASNSEFATGNFTVSDPDGLGDIASVTINGVNVALVSLVGATFAGDHGTLTITAYNAATGVATYQYELTEATTDVADTAETDAFTLTTTDSSGAESAPAAITIEIVDDVPNANDDSAGSAEDQPVTVNVFQNDVAGADGVDLATGVALGDAPTKGNVVYNGDGTFTYTPTAGAEGTDTFTYSITDADGDVDTATVTITLAPDSVPEISIGEHNAVDEGALPGGYLGGDLTSDGTFNISTGGDTVSKLEVQDKDGTWVDVTAGGTVEGPNGTLVVTNTNGSYTWVYTLASVTTDVANVAETNNFAVRVTDSDNDTATTTLSVTINDDVPNAVDDTATQSPENAPVVYNVVTNTDGTSDAPGADGATLTNATIAQGIGTVQFLPNGQITYTPAAGSEGTVIINYTITDADGDTSDATLTITLAPDSVPEISIGDHNAVDEGALPGGYLGGDLTSDGTFNISTGNDTVSKLEVQDKDGNWVDVTAGGTVEGPNGTLVVTNTNGSYTWVYTLASVTTDVANVAETNDFAVRVTDSDNDTATTTLSVTINDDVPNAVDDTATQSPENAPVVYNVVANIDGTSDAQGADGATLTAATVAQGSGSVGFLANGQVTYTPAAGEEGTVIINYTITDADGDTSDATLTITLAADSVPEISIGEHSAVDEGALPGGYLGGDLTSDGTFNIATGGDTVSKLEVQDKDGNWVDVTAGGTVEGPNGTLVVTNTNGSYTWVFTLSSPTTDVANVAETNDFAVRVTDSDNDTANTTLSIVITDDVPHAVDNVNSIGEDAVAAITGNVLTNDASGADAPKSFVSWTSTTASYGTFTDTGNGTYSYTLNNAAVQDLDAGQTRTETFTYTMKDADGDESTATLTITINGSNDTPTITTDSGNPQGANDVVYEAGLAAGTGVGPTTTLVGGTFTVSDQDGLDDIQSVTINGTTIAIGNLGNNNAIVGPNGTLTVTGYNAATGVATYTYQLTSAATDGAGTETNVFTLTTFDGTATSAQAAITITIVDDVPLFNLVNDGADSGSAVTIDVLNPASDTTYNNQFTDWKLGADGFNSATITAPSNVTVISQSASQIVLGLTENGVQVATLTLNADGTDSLLVEHRDGTVVFTPVAATSATAGGPTGSLIVDLGAAADFNILVRGSDGDNTPNEAADEVNTSSNGWAVKGQQGQTIQQNESITFSFVDDGNVNTAFPVDDFKFQAEGYTGGITSATITVKVYLDASLTTYDQMTFDVTSGQVVQIGNLNWSADLNAGNGDYVAGAPIYGVQVISAEPDGSFRLNGVEVGANSDLPPNDLSFENISVSITDGDGDTATQVFNVHIDGSAGNQITVEAIAGTSGANTLNGTSGNDILIGGAGDDLLAGNAGTDTFVWKAGDTGHDTVTDFNTSTEVLNVADLLAGGGLTMTAVAESGHLQLQFSNGTNVVQTIDLTNVAVADNSAAQAMLTNLLSTNHIVD
jgi:VCBS repeat-containing protein